MAQPNVFTHPKFEDDKKQIRLLRFRPGDGEDHTHPYAGIRTNISLEISICDLQAAPAFNAISYTWGDPADAKFFVRINGELFAIRRNCHYALWQARLHYPKLFFWIDAICIDQDSLNEKGHQVLMMGDIFAKAVRVLACVGEHCGRSETVTCAADDIRKHGPGSVRSLWGSKIGFWDAIAAFFTRPYWRRIWVVQEHAVAQRRVVLCGSDRLSSLAIDTFLGLDSQCVARCTWNARPNSLTLGQLSQNFIVHECFDLRDRIYGLLRIIRWPEGTNTILPDYQISKFELVVRLMPEETTRNFGQHLKLLVQLLRLDFRDDDFQHAITCRNSGFHRPLPLAAGCRWRNFRFLEREDPADLSDEKTRFRIARFHRTPSGLVCPALCFTGDETTRSVQHQALFNANHEPMIKLSTQSPLPEPAGLLCPEARSGDFLLELASNWLVIRHLASNTFQIVGQAIMSVPGYYLPPRDTKVSTCSLWTNLSNEDILILGYQDHIADKASGGIFVRSLPGELSEAARCKRPLVKVSDPTNPATPLVRLSSLRWGGIRANSVANALNPIRMEDIGQHIADIEENEECLENGCHDS